MLTAQLTGVREFTLVDQEPADPGPGELQVRVAATGICGSDMHSYLEGGVGDAPAIYPMVLGHEPSGIVLKAGAGVTGWQPGDYGALEPAIFCYHCEFCLRGQHNLCANLRFMSTPTEPGFFREIVNVPAHNLLPVSSDVTVEEAALMEPLAIVLHTLRLGSFRAGESALVMGAGPIGLLTVAALKLFGAKRIWAVEPLAHRRDMAMALGASAVFDPSDPAIRKLNAEIAFDCAAKAATVNECFAAIKPKGRLVITGIHSELHIPFNIHVMRRNEISVFGVRRSNDESEDARDLLQEHVRLFAPLITHKRKLNEIAAAFQLVENYGDGVGKLLII
jgi:2-desacetyl-2-hydroxyethyl bacteriochlorophyllide A dehydrogenase